MILVTGASGFVGRHAIQRLAAAGDRPQLRAMVRDPAHYAAPAGVEVVQGDITRPETLPPALAGVDTIFHAAAITANLKEPYRGAYDAINRGGTQNLVDAAKAVGIKRLVAMSGLGTKPATTGTYMATRWGLEEAIRGSGIPYALLQPSVMFGDGAEFVAALARLARRSPVVPVITSKHDKFQPIWIEDVMTCVERCLTDDSMLNQAHVIGGSEYATFKDVLQTICRAMGKRRLLAPLPLPLARIQARLFQFLPKPPLTPATLELFTFENATDLDAVERTFGFKPRGFREHLMAHGVEV